MKCLGSQCRLDAVIKCIYYRVCAYYHARSITGDRAAPGMGRSKRLELYEKSLKFAADLFENYRDDIKITNAELGLATVRRNSAPSAPDPDGDEHAVYEVDLSS